MSNPEELQEQVKEKYIQLISNKQSKVGQFKQIIPIDTGEGIAVAVVKAAKGRTAQLALQHEVHLLKQLEEMGFPALKTYGEIFEITKDKPAVLVDWISRSSLIDGKTPDGLKYLVPALVTGVRIDTGSEAWAFQVGKVKQTIVNSAKTADLKRIQDFAKTLAQQIDDLMKKMQEKNILIGDLQLLVSPEGKITIIDPLDLIKHVPTNNPSEPFAPENFVDINDPAKKSSGQFVQSLMGSMEMLDFIKRSCEEIAKAQSNQILSETLATLMAGTSRTQSLPASPVTEREMPLRQTSSAPPSPTQREQRYTPITPMKRSASPSDDRPIKHNKNTSETATSVEKNTKPPRS